MERGSRVVLTGANGIGKTTLLSVLMKLEKADSGTISGTEGKKISAVFQENRLLENLDAGFVKESLEI